MMHSGLTEVCKYSAVHFAAHIPAVEVIDMGPVGSIPCCARCAAFYRRVTR